MSLFKKLPSFLAPKSVSHTVGGEELLFYPVPIKLFMELRTLAGPLATAVSVLFFSKSSDARVEQVSTGDQRKGEFISRSIVDPSPLEVVKYRSEEKASAIRALIEAMGDSKIFETLGRVILTSLRDEYVERPVKREAAAEFMEGIDPTTLFELLMGVAKAHAKVFDPLLQRVRAELAKAGPAQPQEPATETTPNTSGSSST